MPEPQTITKVIDQIPHTWVREPDSDGVVRRRGHWQPVPADPQDFQRNSEAFKQALTISGGLMGGMGAGALLPEAATAVGASRFLPVATRILGSAFGGALGRMGAHVPEAGRERATGRSSGTTFGREAVIGAGEGALNEAVPVAFEPVTSTAGTFLKWLGRMGLDNPAASAAARAMMAQRRGWLTAPISYLMGGPAGVAVETAATLGPVVASQTGQGLKKLATKVGTGTLSERLEGPLRALAGKFGVDPTQAERLAAGAENYAAQAEPWRVPKPYPAPRADIPPRVNPTGFTDVDPALAAERGAVDILGERTRGVGNVGVSRPAAPPPPRTRFSWDDWKRGGPAGIETPPIPREGAAPFTTYTDPGPAAVPEVGVRPKWNGFTGSPEVPPPPNVRVRTEGVTGPPEPPSGILPDVTVNPRSVTGPRDYPPSGVLPDVTVNPEGMTQESGPFWWLDKYAIPTSEYGVDALKARSGATNLTPDELVSHYEGAYPPTRTLAGEAPSAISALVKETTPANVRTARGAANLADSFVADASAPANAHAVAAQDAVNLQALKAAGVPEAEALQRIEAQKAKDIATVNAAVSARAPGSADALVNRVRRTPQRGAGGLADSFVADASAPANARAVAENLKPIGSTRDLQKGDFMDALRRSLGLIKDEPF